MDAERLLCIVSELNYGGAETFLMKIYRGIDRNRYQFDFIVNEGTNGVYENEISKLGGIVYEIPYRTTNPWSAFLTIRDIVEKHKYKYILKLSDTPKGLFDLISARLGGAEWISVRSCNSNSDESNIKKIIYGIMRPFFCLLTNQMIAPSKAAGEYTFGKKNIKKVTIIRNGIDIKQYSYDKTSSLRLRLELNLKNKTVYGHIGRFSKQKNHFFLLDIFSNIYSRNNNSILILVGCGELYESIKGYAKDLGIESNMIFYGTTNDIRGILSLFDVLLFPSLYEGLPNTIVEAQCAGVPCLLSDTITEEIAITPLIRFCSLDQQAGYWAQLAMELSKSTHTRTAYETNIINAGYDIRRVIPLFVSNVFHE